MTANKILLQKKYVRVINAFARLTHLNTSAAMGFFYRSLTYKEMSEGIADMHCRSDEYLAEELRREMEDYELDG